METSVADLRFAVRVLRKSPSYTLASVITLALGIGANTAIFSVVNAVFLRPLPYERPERIVWTTEYFPNFKRTQMFVPEYVAWRNQNTVFEQLEAYGISGGMNLAGGAHAAQRVQDSRVTPGFLAVLGIRPQLGRWFRPDEDQPDRQSVAILSDKLWRSYFRSDPKILGEEILLDGLPSIVVGVMPPGFVDPTGADTGVWLPTTVNSKDVSPSRRMSFLGGVIGRLKNGITVDQARANLEIIARRMDGQYPAPWSRYHAAARVRVLALQEHLTNNSKRALCVLMGAVGFLLLISCANIANMFLARALSRQREIAIRASVGASRLRVVRLLLTESLLLSALGGVAGLILMKAGISALGFLIPAGIPARIPIDGRVLAFAIFCSVATSLVFGLAPALATSKVDLNASLKSGGSFVRLRYRGFGIRSAMAAAQLALSMILLVGAGLLLRSFVSLIRVDPGFNTHNVLLSQISLAPQELYGPKRQTEFFGRVLEATRTLPGVEYTALTDESPLASFQSLASGLAAEGQAPSDATVVPTSVSADYFKALQVPLLSGRFFNDRDRDGSPRVVIVNQRLAEILFPNRNPLGLRIQFGDGKNPWVTVVGVVSNIRHRSLDDKIWPELFQPYEQVPSPWMSLAIKTVGDPYALIPTIRATIAQIDRSQALFDVESLDQRISESVAQRRRRAALLSLFALIAFVIATTGVYGVLVYSVTRRTNEMGIRFALGARALDIVSMVMAEGLKISFAGIAAGILGASALTRALSSFLFGVTAMDSSTFVSVGILLSAAACLAAYVPAGRRPK